MREILHAIPGCIYVHYKGGKYLVVGQAERHTHNGDIDVIYCSLTHRKLVTRPMQRDSRNEDSWSDQVEWPDGQIRRRFTLEGDLPCPDKEAAL